MNRFYWSVLFAAWTCSVFAQTAIVKDGNPQCVIVHGAYLTPSDNFALQELREHLKRSTGKDFKVVAEGTSPVTGDAVYLGNTAFARERGWNLSALGREEWIVRSSGNALILAGGGTRGTTYAVYDFLEKELGCRWFDEFNSRIPEHKNLVTSKLSIRRAPAFWSREYGDTFDWWDGIPASIRFKHRNKGTNAGKEEYGWGGQELFGSPGGSHTFHCYSKNWPQSNDGLWHMDKEGRRIKTSTPFSPAFCMSNPEVVSLVADRLKQYVERDRKEAARLKKPYPLIYDIGPNDNPQFCQCPGCKKLLETYRTKSGQLLFLLNAVAEKIEKEYPEIYLRTFAYLGSIEPPSGLRPRKNVIVQLAVLGAEFAVEGMTADTMAPITSDSNREVRRVLERWHALTDRISNWDYWGLANPLACNVKYIPEKLRFYHKNGGITFFSDCSANLKAAFFGLKRYLGYKIMDDPSRNEKQVIADYMNGMYGRGAPQLSAYLDYLTKRQDDFGHPLGNFSVVSLDYMDRDYFLACMKYLETAAALAEKESVLVRRNIAWERIPVIECMLIRWNKLGKMPYDKDRLIAEYETLCREQINAYLPEAEKNRNPEFRKLRTKYLKLLADFLDFARQEEIRIPKELSGKQTRIIPLSVFQINNVKTGRRLRDVDANGGLALCVQGTDMIRKPASKMEFGLYSQTSRQFYAHNIMPFEKLPQDEKYHLYKAGTIDFSQKPGRIVLFAWNSWCIGCPIDTLLTPAELKKNPVVDIYLSFKLEGRDFITGSQKENRFFVDGAFLVFRNQGTDPR